MGDWLMEPLKEFALTWVYSCERLGWNHNYIMWFGKMACILMFMLSLGLFFVGSSWRSCCIRKIPGETGCSKLPSTEVFVFRAEDSWLCLESSTSFVVNFLAKQTPFVLCCFLFAPPPHKLFFGFQWLHWQSVLKGEFIREFLQPPPEWAAREAEFSIWTAGCNEFLEKAGALGWQSWQIPAEHSCAWYWFDSIRIYSHYILLMDKIRFEMPRRTIVKPWEPEYVQVFARVFVFSWHIELINVCVSVAVPCLLFLGPQRCCFSNPYFVCRHVLSPRQHPSRTRFSPRFWQHLGAGAGG